MGGIRGSELEIAMVKLIYKNGGIAFRAPGSGTYTVEQAPIPYTDLQKKCKIEISGIGFIDFGFDPKGYQTADYAGFFVNDDLSPRIQSKGTYDSTEFRFVELKTVRLRKSHLKKGETKESVDKKKHKMTETFNLLQTDKRNYVKRVDKKGKKKKIASPYYGKLRKSDFCMELQRTWYMELLMKRNITQMLRSIHVEVSEDALPINAYLQVRFMGTDREIWIKISDLAKYQTSKKEEHRDTTCTMLDIIKNEKNEISWKWRQNASYKF